MKCLHKADPGFCYECGVFIPKTLNFPIKERGFSCKSYSEPRGILEALESHDKVVSLNTREEYTRSRQVLVNWMTEISETLSLRALTLHSAVYLLDSVVSLLRAEISSYQSLALVCLNISCKTTEIDRDSPKLLDFSRYYPNSSNGLKSLEVEVLMNLNWEINVTVPLHYIEVYLCEGVVYECDGFTHVEHIRKYCEFLADFCLEVRHWGYTSKELAVTYIAISRRLVGLKELWNVELGELTGSSLNVDCFAEVLSLYTAAFYGD